MNGSERKEWRRPYVAPKLIRPTRPEPEGKLYIDPAESGDYGPS